MTGFVYILKTGAFAKVGYSRNPDQRLAQLQVNLPEPSKIIARFPGTRSLEYRLHHYLRDHHLHDEWFQWCQQLTDLVTRGLPDLSAYPKGSPFFPAHNSAAYQTFKVERAAHAPGMDFGS